MSALPFDPILFLFSLLEVAAFWFYLRKLGRPRLTLSWAWMVLAASALIQTLALNSIELFSRGELYDTHHFSFMVLHLGLIFLSVWAIRDIRCDQAFYHALLISMCTRYFEHALGDVTVSINIFYLSSTLAADSRVLGCLSIFVLYLMICLLLARYVDMRGSDVIKRSRLILMSVFALTLEMINNLIVKIMPPPSALALYPGPFLLELLCGFTALIFIVYNEIVLKKAQEQSELNQLCLLMEKQAQQYKQQRNIAFTIDCKYHDLKHHLNTVKALKTNEARQKYITELEAGIKNYETFCYTGNEILDAILGEKLLYCSQHNIRLILLVDGDAVSFVHPTDLVAIFGNALDNAIEAVCSHNESALREIIVRAVVRDNWTVLRFENHSSTPLVDENGIPLTTKPDSSIHGFGLKSISYASKHYGGHCTYKMEKDLFVLTILLARPVNPAELQTQAGSADPCRPTDD